MKFIWMASILLLVFGSRMSSTCTDHTRNMLFTGYSPGNGRADFRHNADLSSQLNLNTMKQQQFKNAWWPSILSLVTLGIFDLLAWDLTCWMNS